MAMIGQDTYDALYYRIRELEAQLAAAQAEVKRANKDRNEWYDKFCVEQTKRVNLQGKFDRDGIAMVALTTQYELLADERNKLNAEVERLKGLREEFSSMLREIKRLKPIEQAAREAVDHQGTAKEKEKMDALRATLNPSKKG